MAEDVTVGDLDVGIDRARSLAAIDNDESWTDDQWDEFFKVLGPLRTFGRQAFDRATDLLAGPTNDRFIACYLLGTLCNPDEDGWGHEAAEMLVRAASDESDDDVLCAIAEGLQSAADPIGIPVLEQLSYHPKTFVRLSVAQGIYFCRTHERDEDLRPIANVLLRLMEDEDGEVRNWATFGVGTQLEVDGVEIRDALASRLDDANNDAHMEAVLGLAHRHDRRAFEPTLRELTRNECGLWAAEAAAFPADDRFVEPLTRLKGSWAKDLDRLDDALEYCDPDRRAERLRTLQELFTQFDAQHEIEGLSLSASCSRVGVSSSAIDLGVDLEVWRNGQSILIYSAERLINVRAAGRVENAIAAILNDVAELDRM